MMTQEEMLAVESRVTEIEAMCRGMRATLQMHGMLVRGEPVLDPLEMRVIVVEKNLTDLRDGVRSLLNAFHDKLGPWKFGL
jgi:hypothetical protein